MMLSVVNAEELTQGEKMQSAVIDGMLKGITGVFNQTVKIVKDPKKVADNVQQYKDEREEAQLKFYKKQYEVRGKALSKISRDKTKVISKLNEEKREWIKKYNQLKKENKELKATIKKYNMYYKNETANKAIKKEETIKKMRMDWKSN
jgi:vacuolar-type H+-ATPase subunit I/STV1